MRRTLWATPLLLLFAGCHAHTVQGKQTTLETPPKEPQVKSERPVRTTPGGMLDGKSMRQVQSALNHHGVKVAESGQLDEETQAALRKFQAREKSAQTGMPDFDTLRKLGLDPKKIYLGGTQRADAERPAQSKRADEHTAAQQKQAAAKDEAKKSDGGKDDSKDGAQ